MKRSLSTLLTALLLTASVMPKAMAQSQTSGFSIGLATSAATIAEQLTPDAPSQTETKTEASPALSRKPALDAKAPSSEGSRPSIDSAYPGYCPSLPAGVKPGDWNYREALEQCLYGS